MNDNFILNDITGEIRAFRARHLQIVNSKNEDVLIPYRQLLNQPIVITKKVDNLKRKTIALELPGVIADNLSRLENDMARCPWIYNPKHYSIEHVKENIYHVHLLAKETFTFNKVEAYLKTKVN